jgi:hypothetical protein
MALPVQVHYPSYTCPKIDQHQWPRKKAFLQNIRLKTDPECQQAEYTTPLRLPQATFAHLDSVEECRGSSRAGLFQGVMNE